MRAGKIHRRVTIQRKSVSVSSSGEQVETWSDLATVWAQDKPNRGDERFSTMQLIGSAVMTFVMRYRADLAVTIQDRLSYGGKTWDILDVRELARRVGWEIDAKARADT